MNNSMTTDALSALLCRMHALAAMLLSVPWIWKKLPLPVNLKDDMAADSPQPTSTLKSIPHLPHLCSVHFLGKAKIPERRSLPMPQGVSRHGG